MKSGFQGAVTEEGIIKIKQKHFCCSVAKLCPSLCDPVDYSTPGSSVLHYLLEFAHIYVHWVSDANLPCHPLLLPSSFVFRLSQHQGFFQWVGSSRQLVSVSGLQLQHQSCNEYSGLISFRIDWFDPLVVQRTLKSLFQHNCLKASILSKVQMCKQKSNAHFRILWSVKEKKWVIEKEIEGQ